jgi:hypothetical protein
MIEAKIVKNKIVIELIISDLPKVVEAAWAAGGIDMRFKVTDSVAFAQDLLSELLSEEEDGTTRVHKMFDGAILEAIEQGAEGIEEHENQEG